MRKRHGRREAAGDGRGAEKARGRRAGAKPRAAAEDGCGGRRRGARPLRRRRGAPRRREAAEGRLRGAPARREAAAAAEGLRREGAKPRKRRGFAPRRREAADRGCKGGESLTLARKRLRERTSDSDRGNEATRTMKARIHDTTAPTTTHECRIPPDDPCARPPRAPGYRTPCRILRAPARPGYRTPCRIRRAPARPGYRTPCRIHGWSAKCSGTAIARLSVHACIHTYIHTYVRTYIHTYIRTHIHDDRADRGGGGDRS